MNLTERILDLLKSKTMTTREVSEALGCNASTVSGTISRLIGRGFVVVVSNEKKGKWTYRAVDDSKLETPLTDKVVEILKAESLTVPEIAQRLQINKATAVSSSVSMRVNAGELIVVGTKASEKTGRMLKIYGFNPRYVSNRRSSSITRDKEVNKELRKHFRVFRPTHDRHVLGMWM